MTITRPSANESKLRELIIYIATLEANDESFGVTKLSKLCFRIDFTAFVELQKPVTGVKYFALHEGPSPRPMKKLLEMMQKKGEINIVLSNYAGGDQQRVTALRPAKKNVFTTHELGLASRIVQQYWGKSGRTMSSESHELLRWSRARLREDIPYQVALIGDRDPTREEIKYGLELETLAQQYLSLNAARRSKTPNDNREPSI
jgi:Protein of unknown function (DUF4065)